MTEMGVSHGLGGQTCAPSVLVTSSGIAVRPTNQEPELSSGIPGLSKNIFKTAALGVPVLPEQFLSPFLIVCVPKQGTGQRHDDVYQITRIRKVILAPERGNESS